MASPAPEFDPWEFTDRCFLCREVTPSWKVLRSDRIDGVSRSYHECKEEHFSVSHADWWTDRRSDWRGEEILERIRILDPSDGGGGTTWSGTPLPPRGW